MSKYPKLKFIKYAECSKINDINFVYMYMCNVYVTSFRLF